MIATTIERLEHLLDTIPAALEHMPDTEFSFKPAPGVWSRKEILGHLIDSAANNHQRFIRTRYENVPFIVYNQDQWNVLNYYDQADKKHLIAFWTLYNRHLLQLMKHIPDNELGKTCNTGDAAPVTLGRLIQDYLQHLEHHLLQIFGDPAVLDKKN